MPGTAVMERGYNNHSWLPELPCPELALVEMESILTLARVHLCRRIQDNGSSSDLTSLGNDAQPGDASCDPFMQNMFVLCHGEEVKTTDVDVDGDGDGNARAGARPWDPPLTAMGKLQAWRVGRLIRLEGWNVTRVVVSPFLRCVQTAAEVIAGLSLLPSSVILRDGDHGSPGSLSSVKVSIECGLAENLMNKGRMISHFLEDEVRDGLQPWTLDLAELYSMLPTEICDPSFQPINQQLPESRESSKDIRYRYTSTLKEIANRCPRENILCITHGEAVRQSVSMMWPSTEVHGVAYCAYTHAQRPVFERDDDSYILNGDWELLTESGSCSGIFFIP